MSFTGHNIRLDDGSFTRPDAEYLWAETEQCASMLRTLELVFGKDLQSKSIVDLGCLEGGYTVEFARRGMQALGIEVRQSNFANCEIVRNGLSLPLLRFVRDDVRNIMNYPEFDAAFCSGILYHLDRPVEFLRNIAGRTRKVLIVNTHYAMDTIGPVFGVLSEMTHNEEMPGRWYPEYEHTNDEEGETHKWSSWINPRSFWLTRPAIVRTLKDVGFDAVFEQFDWMDGDYLESMTTGFYATNQRTTFIGVRTGH